MLSLRGESGINTLKKEELSAIDTEQLPHIEKRKAFEASSAFFAFRSYLPMSYVAFLAGMLISGIGDAFFTFAIPWISYELTHSAVVMGSMYAVTVLPILLFGPFIGVLVDRGNRRRLMLSADVISAGLVALIPVFHFMGWLHLWQLYATSFVLPVLSMLFEMSTFTMIPLLVVTELTRANGAYQLVKNAASFGGPILAGIVLASVGGYNTLWFDVLSFAATFLAVWRLPVYEKSHSSNNLDNSVGNVLQGMKDGLRWLIRDRLNFSLSLQATVGNFGYSTAAAVLMFYLLSTLHLNAQQVSYNYSLIGVGGILGSILVVPLARRIRRGALISLMLTIGAIGFSLPLFAKGWIIPGVAFGIVTICNVAWNTLVQATRQESVPPDMLGRSMSFSRVFTRLAMPLGAMVGGALSSHFNPVSVFAVGMAAKGVEILISLLSPIRTLR